MKLLDTINFENTDDEAAKGFEHREASRAVLFDNENKVAILEITSRDYHKLPGGGIEQGEGKIEALKRECLEETGCEIEVTGELGWIDEYRAIHNLHQISYCYTARVVGEKGEPDFTEKEKIDGSRIIWVPMGEAIRLLTVDKSADYGNTFFERRDVVILKEAQKIFSN